MPAKNYIFLVEGIKCQSCSKAINGAFVHTSDLKEYGIISARCDSVTKELTVIADSHKYPDMIRKVKEIVDDTGFECELLKTTSPLKKDSRPRRLLGFMGTGSGAVLLGLNLLGITFPLPLMVAIALSSVALTLFLGAEFYVNAFKVFKHTRELNMNTLFALSTLTVLAVSVTAFFVPTLPMMFDAGLLIFGFRHLGMAIESSIKRTVISGIQFKDYLPPTVREAGSNELKPLVAIKLNDVLEIREGEVIPTDGQCLSGKGLIYDTIDTGARIPRQTRQDEPLLAGMFLAAGSPPIRLKVSKKPADSYLARFDEQLINANQKQPLQTAAKKILQYFIPLVILLALLSLAVVSYFFPPAVAIQCAVAVLVSACPCTLGMIIPMAVKVGMNKAAAGGAQFKSSKALEEVGELTNKVDTVVFDLHGTLTKGKPSVMRVEKFDPTLTEEDMLAHIALLEKDSPHPVAKAIREYLGQKKIKISDNLKLTELNQSSHSGISATINDAPFVLGSKKMMTAAGISTAGIKPDLSVGDSLVYLARHQKIIGYLLLSDPLRDDARFVVNYLKKQGKTVCLCTGADKATADRYAHELGINEVRAAQRGSVADDGNSKMAYIHQLQKAEPGHCVAMIGDGPNDAPALAASNLAIAVKTGDDIGHKVSQEQAGVLIDDASLKPVLAAFSVANQTVSNIKQNLLFSFGYNFFTMALAGGALLAFGFAITPAVGAGLMVVQSGLILLNTYRFKEQPLDHLNEAKRDDLLPTKESSYQHMLNLKLESSLSAVSKHDTETQPSRLLCGGFFNPENLNGSHENRLSCQRASPGMG